MPLRLVTGAANAGKTGVAIDEALAALARGESPVLAVPHLADARRLESELSGKAPLGIRVAPLRGFVETLWALHGDGRRAIDSYTRQSLLLRATDEAGEAALESIAQTRGFQTFLTRMALESSEIDSPGRPSSEWAAAVARVFKRYRYHLSRLRLVEPGWLSDLVGELSPELGGPLGLVRFDHLRARDIRLLAGLARTNNVTVGLTWEAGLESTRANDPTVSLFREMGAEHTPLHYESDGGELQRLTRGLCSGAQGLASDGRLVGGLVSGSEAEVELAAEIVADEIERGIELGRILVAFPRTSARADALYQAFAARGVPIQADMHIPVSSTGFGRAWRNALFLASGLGGRAEALEVIARIKQPGDPDPSLIDRAWRLKGVDKPAALLESMAKSGGRRRTLVDLARRAARLGLSADTLACWQDLADELVVLGDDVDGAGAAGWRARQDAAAHNAIVRILAEIARHADTGVAAMDVLAACEATQVHAADAERMDRVAVCDFDRVGARRFDVVVLGGLTEDEVAAPPTDTLERELLDSASVDLDAAPLDRLRLEFYSLLSRARSRVYLLRREADSEGRDLRPSILWEDVADLYRAHNAPPDEPPDPSLPIMRIARSEIERLAPALTVGRRELRGRAGELEVGSPNRGNVVSARALSAVRAREVFSVTEIEAYLACPYRWFYERVVRPEEIDTAVGARELGSLAHEILAEFYRRLRQTGRARVSHATLTEDMLVFDDVATTKRSAVLTGGLADEIAAARAVQWARNVVGQDANFLPGFEPRFVEVGFGADVPFEFAGERFRGRIDRIDVGEEGSFVTDYKSSLDVPGMSKFAGEGRVQAVVYAAAAEAQLGVPTCGSVYRSMRSGRLRGYWRSDLLGHMPQGMCADDAVDVAGCAELVELTEAAVASAVEGMRAGRIPREPQVRGACGFCPLSTTCEGARS